MDISRFSFGCHNLTGGSSWLRSQRLIHCALDMGIRRFDVAPCYGLGTAERTLSDALGRRRDSADIEITTKFGILPPRYGQLMAWLREPYRALRSLALPSHGDQLPPPVLATTANFTGTALEAVEASRRALRVDRVGAFLSHERLCGVLAERFADDMRDIVRRGLVGRIGCSGDVSNVAYMQAQSEGLAQIVQIALQHHANGLAATELRFFNIGNSTRQLARVPSFAKADADLGDAIPARYELNDFGRRFAGVLVWLELRFPRAILIINASSARRLSALVEATTEPALRHWVYANKSHLESAIDKKK